ncbi:MAG: O-methyltransferase [Planctomycetes bacterium]|nr:O-methyltransferase [Planctomycetota bacterium]MCC7398042.1 O-methyltransferase [Planctomycetota bacterium]
MSKSSTPVDERLFAFLAARTIPEDRLLAELRRAAAAAGLPEIHIAPEQAAFLQLLLRATGARTVVEVGTLGGYSAIVMARGLPADGRVITHEIEPRHAEFARQWIAGSDQAGKIEVRVGDAATTLSKVPDDTVDAVFLDADKAGYVVYLQQAMRMLRRGGVVLADNVLADGDVANGSSATAVAMRAFLDAAAACGLPGVIVPLGDGCWFGVKG